MKVGIIGGGFGLRVQAPIIATHKKMQLTAVSTMSRHSLSDEVAQMMNPPVHYKDWKEMLDSEPLDLLFVSSLPAFHFEMVTRALHKNIHVVCEKPFTMNHQESEALIQLSNQTNRFVFVDFEWRYLSSRQKVKELLTTKSIGEILHYEHHISSPGYQRLKNDSIGWMGNKEQLGGMLGAVGTHMIDCFRWLLRDEINRINAHLHTHVPSGAEELRDADDAFFLHGRTQKGSTFSIQLLSGVSHGFGSSLKIFGTDGTLTLENDQTLTIGEKNEPLKPVEYSNVMEIPPHLSKEASAYYPAFYPFIDHVQDSILRGIAGPDLPTVEDGHQNQIILDQLQHQ